MNAAQNAQRWAVDQKRKARAATSAQMEREREEKLAGLRASLAAIEAFGDHPAIQQLARNTRRQIADLSS